MRFRQIHLITTIAPLMILAACAQEKAEEAASAVDAASEAAAVGSNLPDVSRVAPGVAFAFQYDFTLPTDRISETQQAHAAACAELGLDQCRVTGIEFRQTAEDEGTGRLNLLLAPELAHRFGRDAVEIVRQADGRVESATIAGEDAGSRIDASHQTSRALRAEAARIEARLATKGLTRDSRTELESRLSEVRRQLAEEAGTRKAAEKSIATTPVTFNYGSQGLLSGGGNPFTSAAKASFGSLGALLSFLLIVGGGVLPWLALFGLGWLAWRKFRPASRPPEPTG